MFASALEKARGFTRPIFAAYRFYDGSTDAGIMACVFLNAQGWFVTAAHALDAALASQQHATEIAAFTDGEARIKADPRLNSKQRHKLIRKLAANPKWITNQIMVVAAGDQLLPVEEWHACRGIDLAVGRVKNFNPQWIQAWPVFKNPSVLRQGTSICRLGYPFLPVKCTYDSAANHFHLDCQVAFFPNEGIFTRELIGPLSPDGPFTERFIETSSAGLRGQSGGPLVDSQGLVWGIQAHTAHLDLGFPPNIKLQTGKDVEVYQFMNVGRAVHPLTVHEFLTHLGVPFASESAGGTQ